ncbi:penicillin acylase family protein [Sphingopyxis fribergensis]
MTSKTKSAELSRPLAALLAVSALFPAAAAHAAPKAEATITRTQFGIPHIKAKDYRGLGFGIAYAEAQDNICLMADSYLSISGERSKYLGADKPVWVGIAPATNIDNDIYYSVMNDTAKLRAALKKSSPEYRALVDGWVAGYNRFLADNKDKLPAECAGQPWVRPITRDDAVLSLNSFSMLSGSATSATKITNAAPPSDVVAPAAAAPQATGAPQDTMPVHPGGSDVSMTLPADAKLGSNAWAFGGDATTNGRGLVVGNPHFPWFGPNRFYQMHLTIPGKLDVAGAGIINQPFVGIGFNKDVAWSHTVDTAAHMMLSKLALDPSDPTVYIVDGKKIPMERRQLRIENKGGAPIERTIHMTRYGPIIAVPGTPYAWTRETAYAVTDVNRGNIRGGDGWLAMARARDVRELRGALAKNLHIPFLNTVAADRHGDALYADISATANVSAKRFAECGSVSEPTMGFLQRLYVLDGSRSSCGLEKAKGTPEPGLLPASDMATIYRRDFVQNSNDSYRWTNPAADIAELGPMMGTDPKPLPDLRTRSALQEIRTVLGSGKFDVDSGAATMLGNKNFAAQLVLPGMLKLCKRPAAPGPACDVLAKWDGKTEIDSRGAALFAIFWGKAETRPDLWTIPFDRKNVVGTPGGLAIEGAKGDALLGDLAFAVAVMTAMGLPLDGPLGDVQFAERGDLRIPISGGPNGGVLNYTAALPGKGGFTVIFGGSYIQSVTFDDHGPVAKAILTYSQSANPASPHYVDQTWEYSKKKLHSYPFTEAEIAAKALGAPVTIKE